MRIGISGYMGAGKSTCTGQFRSPETLILDGDQEAKKLMQSDHRIQSALVSVFGKHIKKDSDLRFDQLAAEVFRNRDTLKLLNSIVHPNLIERIRSLIFNDSKPLCILDAALIPLWHIESWFDHCIWIDVSFGTRFNRLKQKREDLSDFELKRRMQMQQQLFDVPRGQNWIRLPDKECSDFIRSILQKHHLDLFSPQRES
ncbi:MAG: dephospho-CoA kinase [Chitinispirillaceae bacterium]